MIRFFKTDGSEDCPGPVPGLGPRPDERTAQVPVQDLDPGRVRGLTRLLLPGFAVRRVLRANLKTCGAEEFARRDQGRFNNLQIRKVTSLDLVRTLVTPLLELQWPSRTVRNSSGILFFGEILFSPTETGGEDRMWDREREGSRCGITPPPLLLYSYLLLLYLLLCFTPLTFICSLILLLLHSFFSHILSLACSLTFH